jgi:hypothetical protein
MRKILTLAVVSTAFLVASCGGSDKAADTVAEETKAVAEGSGDLAKAAAGATGVAECDNYLTKVMACVEDKIPEAQRAMIKKSMDDSKASWAAVTDKAALAKTCQNAMDQAKASYAAMGCSF